jgi:membrane protein DedA with SNARE-associated domain
MQEFIESWGPLGVFLGILASGLGLPIPEELPIVIGGSLSGTRAAEAPWWMAWWIMLPVCIVGVIIGDCSLYLIGRYFGSKLIQLRFVRTKLLTPERFAKIADNFQIYGVKILLFARLTPGIRAPIFLTAGITKLPITKFLIADAIYAIPGVSLLFFLGYWFSNSVIDVIEESENLKPIIVLVVLACIALYLVYRVYRKPMVTGAPAEMPVIVGQVTETLDHAMEKVMHRAHPSKAPTPEEIAEEKKPRQLPSEPDA